jgi:holo-[acyl-carrier protein] synthase
MTIGTDIVEVERFRSMDQNTPFLQRVFSKEEIEYCMGYSTPAPHLAATFAGKEAVVKALEKRASVQVSDIEILRTTEGIPFVRLKSPVDLEIAISLSHSESYAVAMAIAYPFIDGLSKVGLRKLLNGTISQIQPE